MIRRDFFKYSIFTAALLTTNSTIASIPNKNRKSKIVICGAGFAGLTCAKNLKQLNNNINVTLIEKNNNFSSCPFSNLWLGDVGNISYEDLNYDYYKTIEKNNFNFINEEIIKIDKNKKLVYTTKNIIEYEYLILTLGIDYNYEKIFKNKKKIQECKIKAPAALKPGSEHLALKRMIKNFKGGNFIISIPNGAYKCPPAPYERACMIANYFKENNIKGKVVILDPRDKPAAKPYKFLEAFKKYYKNYIIYKPYSQFKDVDFIKKKITYKNFDENQIEYINKKIDFEEANIIPPNQANSLIKKSNLEVDEMGWAKLKKPTFRSTSSEDIYILGDSQGEYSFAKSAQMANSCAYIVSEEIVSRIKNKSFDYKNNMPGNVCYSMITKNKAVSITHNFKYKDTFIPSYEISEISHDVTDAAKGWYFGLINDILEI
ncbi:hypothetical protein CRV00_11395 [Malaciobacter molluscorum]|uniref:FAD-dependent oxidoreductase n=1 Tax=Malaciobacter molluscorum TaxID=1032072 RepID=UPI00100B380E|nr:FAD-dependent oxidoreductase [Malaciobacter molluscorum]RXJ93380.1 hypothetical protein CRV00_11395 [Malaciobacter molluscorum]